MSYEKQTWQTGDVITAEKLNHMEDGIESGGGSDYSLANLTFVNDGDDLIDFEFEIVTVNPGDNEILTRFQGYTNERIASNGSKTIKALLYKGYSSAFYVDGNYTISGQYSVIGGSYYMEGDCTITYSGGGAD